MEELNKNDNKLLEFCEEFRSIGEIARHLNIAPKNVSVRVNKLQNKNLLHVKKAGPGKKTRVRTKSSVKYPEYLFAILKHIKKKGGIYEEEFNSLFDDEKFNSLHSSVKEYDRLIAKWIIKDAERPLVKSKLFINDYGEVFLGIDNENKKKNKSNS
ncbi:hypothetical protein CMI38_02735 [Candidatus Pacearchaeota archaeon]|jgi:hypothetical protein|nr:hypothetical protein [Candidatus Pacearchaeota archaeon]|tara:strand:- start:3138 stop:3605 length:468 start_codon:yes stop_codon:yes gene_type:complete